MSTLAERVLSANADGKYVCGGLDSNPANVPMRHLGLGLRLDETLRAQEAFVNLQRALLSDEPVDFGKLMLTQRQRWVLSRALLAFNKRIVRAVGPYVAALKTNSGFYEGLGAEGIWARDQTLKLVKLKTRDVLSILDFKRGDIDNTNVGYLVAALYADAVTLHPYMGRESLSVFLNRPELGCFILVRTSNKGAGELQDLDVPGGYYDDTGEQYKVPLYNRVATAVAQRWNERGNCGVVAGATWPDELAKIREKIGPKMPILIPGIGAQQGDLELSFQAGTNDEGQGAFFNDSRKMLFASPGADFDEAAEARVIQLNQDCNSIRAVVA